MLKIKSSQKDNSVINESWPPIIQYSPVFRQRRIQDGRRCVIQQTPGRLFRLHRHPSTVVSTSRSPSAGRCTKQRQQRHLGTDGGSFAVLCRRRTWRYLEIRWRPSAIDATWRSTFAGTTVYHYHPTLRMYKCHKNDATQCFNNTNSCVLSCYLIRSTLKN